MSEADLLLRPPSVYAPEPDPALSDERGETPTKTRAHPLNDSIGWAFLQVRENSTEINSWTLRPLQRLSPLIDSARESESWPLDQGEAWGPFEDPRGNPLEWVVWSSGSRLELRVRPEGDDADYRSFWTIEFESPAPEFAATLSFDASLLSEMPDLGSHVHDEWRVYDGRFDLHLSWDSQGMHQVDIDWFDFVALDTGLGDSTFDPRSSLEYRRAADGSGFFALTMRRPYDDDIGFTGPAPDLARLEMHWDEGEHSFSSMEVDDPGQTNPEGDPLYGSLVIHECSNDNGGLVWRDIADAYLEVQPDYEKGALEACQGSRPWPAID